MLAACKKMFTASAILTAGSILMLGVAVFMRCIMLFRLAIV